MKIAILTNTFTEKNRLINIVAMQSAFLTIPGLHSGFNKRDVVMSDKVTAIMVEPDGTGAMVMHTSTRTDAHLVNDLFASGFSVADGALLSRLANLSGIVEIVRKAARKAVANHIQTILNDFTTDCEKFTVAARDEALARLDKLKMRFKL